MARSKRPGITWDPKTGKGRIDKVVRGRRILRRFTASNWAEVDAEFARAVATVKESFTVGRTFRAAATRYLEESTHSSIARDAGALAKLDPWIGKLELPAVHQGTLQPYISAQRQAGIKSATVARELAVVRRILSLAARLWRDEHNQPWLATVPMLDMPDWRDQAKPYPLTWDESRALLHELPTHLEEMALFALHTGTREAVICGLRWDWEIKVPELATSVFLVPAMATKNGTEFLLVLNHTARSVIEAQRGRHPDHVFTYEGQPVSRMHNTAWKKAWKRAGLPQGRDVLSGPHNLRHTFARRLRAAGVPLETRRVLMHHCDGDITVHYSPAEINELIDAVEKLQDAQRTTLLRRVG